MSNQLTNQKYLIQYESQIESGRDSGYKETRNHVVNEKISISRIMEKFPNAKLFKIVDIPLEERIQIVREAHSEAERQEKQRKLAVINDQIRKLEKERQELEGDN